MLPLVRPYVGFFARLIPARLPANYVTIGSTLVLWFAFAMNGLFAETLAKEVLVLLTAACVHLYMVGDLLDGLHARRTKTSSFLGQYFDHSLDSINTCLVMGLNVLLFEVEEVGWIVVMMASASLPFLFTQAEEKVTGKFQLEKFGVLEALVFIQLAYLSLLFEDVREFLSASYREGLKNYVALIFLLAISALVTMGGSLVRMRKVPVGLVKFTLFYLLFALALEAAGFNVFLVWTALTFLFADFVCRVVYSSLSRSEFPKVRPVQFILLLLAGLYSLLPFSASMTSAVAVFVVAFPFLSFLFVFVVHVHAMRGMWLWINPKAPGG